MQVQQADGHSECDDTEDRQPCRGEEGSLRVSVTVVHYVAIIGLYRANEDGTVGTNVVVAPGQADYITDGQLLKSDEVLAEERATAEEDDG